MIRFFLPSMPVVAALFLAVPAALPAQAQTTGGEAVFSAERDGQTVTVRTASRTLSDNTYADFQGLAEGLGAGYAVTASRVQIDLGGASAWVYFNDNRVTASRSEFTLAHPVIQRDGRAWVSVRDAGVFFQQAFQIELRAQAAEAANNQNPLVDFNASLLDEPLLPAQAEPDAPAVADETPLDPLQEISPDAIRDLRTARGPERVVIDAAHGGDELGVIGPTGLLEKEVVLGVATALRERLSGRIGREVVLTREDDRPLETAQRAALVTDPGRTLFISVHCGGAFSQEASGVAVFYLTDIVDESLRQLGATQRQQALAQRSANATASRRLAERVARTVSERTGSPSRGVHGVASRLLMAAGSPGILVEVGCLTSPDDEERLAGAAYQQQVAAAVAEAILAHYGLESPGAAR